MRTRSRHPLVSLVFAVILLAVGLFNAITTAVFLSSAEPAIGTVSSVYACERYKRGECADVQFHGSGGKRFSLSLGSTKRGSFLRGQKVDVLYDPDDPQSARRGNAGDLWVGPLITLSLGVIGLLLARMRAKDQGGFVPKWE